LTKLPFSDIIRMFSRWENGGAAGRTVLRQEAGSFMLFDNFICLVNGIEVSEIREICGKK